MYSSQNLTTFIQEESGVDSFLQQLMRYFDVDTAETHENERKGLVLMVPVSSEKKYLLSEEFKEHIDRLNVLGVYIHGNIDTAHFICGGSEYLFEVRDESEYILQLLTFCRNSKKHLVPWPKNAISSVSLFTNRTDQIILTIIVFRYYGGRSTKHAYDHQSTGNECISRSIDYSIARARGRHRYGLGDECHFGVVSRRRIAESYRFCT